MKRTKNTSENKIKQGLVRQANIGNGKKILEIAGSKISSSGRDISLDTGMAFELPYPGQLF